MTLRLYDTAQRAVVPFEPGPIVSMYVCGITPYDSTHLGHAATYLTYDLLIRRLEELGHEVRMVRNVTDVDDSILPKARELGVPYLELADSELARFRSDMEALEMRPPVAEPRATESIDGMIDMVAELLDTGHAYLTHGTVVLRRVDVPALRRAVALLARPHGAARPPARRQSRRPAPPRPARLRAVAAVAARRAGVARAVRRRSPRLARRVLGDVDGEPRHHLDLHGGGTDLIFPHHECEIAQSESVTGEPFCRHWVHSAMVSYEGEKMSKSLGNLVFVSDLLKRADPARDPPRAHAPPLPRRLRVARHRPRRGHRAPPPAAGGRRAIGRRRSRARSPRACVPPSTTTSTRRRRSRRSTTSRAPSSRVATTRRRPVVLRELGALLGVDLARPIVNRYIDPGAVRGPRW